ncbi:hypothetical protein T439DRAFT_376654 [Meredithblackwellia eburnea MCA 4105]
MHQLQESDSSYIEAFLPPATALLSATDDQRRTSYPPLDHRSTPTPRSVNGGVARSEQSYTHNNDHYSTTQPYQEQQLTRTSADHFATSLNGDLALPPAAHFLPASSASNSAGSYKYHSINSNSNNLPHFSAWPPSWISGGISSNEGRAFTTHTPPAYNLQNYQSPPPNSYQEHSTPALYSQEKYHNDGDEDDDDPNGLGGWVPEPPFVGEWQAPAGDYNHGVGFNTHSTFSSSNKSNSSSSSSPSSDKVAERLRRLEREFGSPTAPPAKANAQDPLTFNERLEKAKRERLRQEKNFKNRNGVVDSKGRLITQGRRKRLALRWFQGLAPFVVGFTAIGASLFTHPKNPAPPSRSAPLFVLYILPFISLILTVYLLLIRPRSVRQIQKYNMSSQVGSNGMVFPLMQQPQFGGMSGGGGCCCFGRSKGRLPKDWQRQQQQMGMGMINPPAVNLVLDQSILGALLGGSVGGGRGRQSADGLTTESREAKDRRRRRRRRRREREHEKERAREREKEGVDDGKGENDSVFGTGIGAQKVRSWADRTDLPGAGQRTDPHEESDLCLHSSDSEGSSADTSDLEEEKNNHWGAGTNRVPPILLKVARHTVRVMLWWDLLAGVVWAALCVWAIGFGKSCSPGTFQGWCNFYNTALAISVLLSITFFTSFAFGFLDLRRTRGGNS